MEKLIDIQHRLTRQDGPTKTLEEIFDLMEEEFSKPFKDKIAELQDTIGMLTIDRDHEKRLRESCEIALTERDSDMTSLKARLRAIELTVDQTKEANRKLYDKNESLKEQIAAFCKQYKDILLELKEECVKMERFELAKRIKDTLESLNF